MSLKICVSANALPYPEHGGHMWVYLNWCLGLKEIGCRVVWLDGLGSETSRPPAKQLSDLRTRLEQYGLASDVAVWTNDNEPVPADIAEKCLGIEGAVDADLLINLYYETPAQV